MEIANFNLVDLLLAVVVLLGAWSGWRHGFVLAALELLALTASVVTAFIGYPFVAEVVRSIWTTGGVWIAPLAFLFTFMLAHLVFGVVAGKMVRAVPPRAHGHGINRFFGLAPGAVKGVVYATIVSMVLLTVPIADSVSRMAREGQIASRLAGPAEWIESQLSPIFDPAVRRTLQAIIVPPESKAFVPLKFKVANPKPRPDLELRLLALVNQERDRQGLKPLKPDTELEQVARAHSRDMFARGYFSHVSPEGRNLGDRLKQAGVRYLVAGENLALAQTLSVAHQGLMNSPGHRANILRPQFGRLGVGVLDGGVYGLMVTENFRN